MQERCRSSRSCRSSGTIADQADHAGEIQIKHDKLFLEVLNGKSSSKVQIIFKKKKLHQNIKTQNKKIHKQR